MKIQVLAIIILMLAGCGQSRPEAPAKQPSKSTFQQSVEGFTGKTAVDNYHRAADKIKAIDAERKQNFEEDDLAP